MPGPVILIVEKNCSFCEEFKETPGLLIAELSADGKTLDLNGETVPCPILVRGIPCLLDGSDVYIGRTLVRERLLKVETPCAA